MGKQRLTKNQKRRLKKKQLAKKNNNNNNVNNQNNNKMTIEKDIEVDEYVTEEMDEELMKHFDDIVKNKMFQIKGKEEIANADVTNDSNINGATSTTTNTFSNNNSIATNKTSNNNPPNTKSTTNNNNKKNRMTLAELKYKAKYPDVIEPEDVASPAPLFLAELKGYPNYVPVPRHWKDKRGYLQGKRSVEESTYQLPDYIAATGIQEVRQAALEAEEGKTLKQVGRAKMRPKMGQMDIDYKILHDAFFKYQTEPEMTNFGDLYYENKEFETKKKFHGIPGVLSKSLREALGMPPGMNIPPPFLLNMQREGPPKAYPNLKLPGVNAPLPEGCKYGFQMGGWGQPPLDPNTNRPLWGGDLFGGLGNVNGSNNMENGTTVKKKSQLEQYMESFDRTKTWGKMQEKVYDDDDDDDDEEEDGDDQEKNNGNDYDVVMS